MIKSIFRNIFVNYRKSNNKTTEENDYYDTHTVYISNFSPKGKTFCFWNNKNFTFNKNECFKLDNDYHICSLDIYTANLDRYSLKTRYDDRVSAKEIYEKILENKNIFREYGIGWTDSMVLQCKMLEHKLRKNQSMTPVDIVKFSCGRYGIGDGRHRICIARKLNISVPVELDTAEEVCGYCEGRDEYLLKL